MRIFSINGQNDVFHCVNERDFGVVLGIVLSALSGFLLRDEEIPEGRLSVVYMYAELCLV